VGQGDGQYLFLLKRKEDRGSHASLETHKDPAGRGQQRAGRHTLGVWRDAWPSLTQQHTHSLSVCLCLSVSHTHNTFMKC